ncbi:hypothetical protein MAM1_1199d11508 [Mucor ambiguus]|uniref:CCHC-type domain-containing protein n=1 Tax=Mucor ambiguus TaxID=91626 RepID=A0A0C9MM81_9FUNG|nr:hypothetical protein MAM1_1199d11508 [Mucor ambiguus]
MPDFCRICQKPDHCKADCPDAKRFIQCHNCNAHGHISRNCPRQEISVTPSKKPTLELRKPRKSPTSTVVSEPNPPIGPRQVETRQQETTDTGASKQQLETPQTSQKETGIEEEMDVDTYGTNRANDGQAVTPNAGTSGAQTSAVNKKQQALEAPTKPDAPALTDRELVQYLIPDENMKEPLHLDRPAAEDAPTGKKPRKQLEQGTRKTRGSLASKFSTDNKNKDTTVDSVSIQEEQGTTDTAQSSTPNQE